jgi:hypothetical protein
MQQQHRGGRAMLGLATVLVLVVGLVGTATATAAPGSNVTDARECLWGGWKSLQPNATSSFHSLPGCLIFALRGGTFFVAPPSSGGSE